MKGGKEEGREERRKINDHDVMVSIFERLKSGELGQDENKTNFQGLRLYEPSSYTNTKRRFVSFRIGYAYERKYKMCEVFAKYYLEQNKNSLYISFISMILHNVFPYCYGL